MRARDIPGALQLQRACYPADMLETEGTFAAILALDDVGGGAADTDAGDCGDDDARAHCWVAERESTDGGGVIDAYLLAHAIEDWRRPPALDAPLRQLPRVDGAPRTLFIHDLAVSPLLHRSGLGSRMVRVLLEAHWLLPPREQCSQPAHGVRLYECAAAVAVQGAHAFWRRQGFRSAATHDGAPAPPLDERFGAGAETLVFAPRDGGETAPQSTAGREHAVVAASA